MKKSLLAIALCLGLASTASAAWVKIGEVPGGSVYVEPKTASAPTADTRRAWMLIDLQQKAAAGLPQSVGILQEINCKTGKSRAIIAVVTDGPMGTGKVLDADDSVSPETEVETNSPIGVVGRVLCSMKTKAKQESI